MLHILPTETVLCNVKWRHGAQPPLQSGHGGAVSLEVMVILITYANSSTSTEHHSSPAVPTECVCCGNSPSPSASSLCRELPITATKSILHPVYPISQRLCSLIHAHPVPQLPLPTGQSSAIAMRGSHEGSFSTPIPQKLPSCLQFDLFPPNVFIGSNLAELERPSHLSASVSVSSR